MAELSILNSILYVFLENFYFFDIIYYYFYLLF